MAERHVPCRTFVLSGRCKPDCRFSHSDDVLQLYMLMGDALFDTGDSAGGPANEDHPRAAAALQRAPAGEDLARPLARMDARDRQESGGGRRLGGGSSPPPPSARLLGATRNLGRYYAAPMDGFGAGPRPHFGSRYSFVTHGLVDDDDRPCLFDDDEDENEVLAMHQVVRMQHMDPFMAATSFAHGPRRGAFGFRGAFVASRSTAAPSRGRGAATRGRAGGVPLSAHSADALDVDHMSYEELSALCERQGDVSTGVPQDVMRRMPAVLFLDGIDTGCDGPADCAICITEYESDDTVRVLPCQHKFHAACIDQWFSSKRLCPVCKVDVVDACKQLAALSSSGGRPRKREGGEASRPASSAPPDLPPDVETIRRGGKLPTAAKAFRGIGGLKADK
jgi:hypothetical protein